MEQVAIRSFSFFLFLCESFLYRSRIVMASFCRRELASIRSATPRAPLHKKEVGGSLCCFCCCFKLSFSNRVHVCYIFVFASWMMKQRGHKCLGLFFTLLIVCSVPFFCAEQFVGTPLAFLVALYFLYLYLSLRDASHQLEPLLERVLLFLLCFSFV